MILIVNSIRMSLFKLLGEVIGFSNKCPVVSDDCCGIGFCINSSIAICLNPITIGGRIDCCKHTFCLDCIKQWSEVCVFYQFFISRDQIDVHNVEVFLDILLLVVYLHRRNNYITVFPIQHHFATSIDSVQFFVII